MEIGDIIICSDTKIEEGVGEPSPIIRLTLGKEYKITWCSKEFNTDTLYVVDDYGAARCFFTWRFMTRAQWREKQLEKIL